VTEIRFYHLTQRPLEAVLPVMLERCLDRGWRVVVRSGDPERLADLDRRLWTWRPESFLPHASARDGDGARQPIWLTVGEDLPNAPDTLFLVDGAQGEPADLARFATAAILFDGHDADRVAAARALWRAVTGAGLKAVYWAEDAQGAWTRRAESG